MPSLKKKPGRPKGLPKTGGRKKGTPNKNNPRMRFEFAARGFDFVGELIAALARIQDPIVRAEFLLKLAPFFMQRLREDKDELAAPIDETEDDARFSNDDLLKLVKMQ